MRNFLKIAENVETAQLLHALYRSADLWNQCTLRTGFAESPHREVDDIILRLQPLDGSSSDPRECIDYPAFGALPEAKRLVYALMAMVYGERLGRVMITRLAPGRKIYRHADVGPDPRQYDTVRYYSRHHIVLQAERLSMFEAGGEVCHMAPGEVWWFDNSVEHEVWNDGHTDRIHLIADIRCAGDPR